MKERKQIILFDGVCNLCDGFVQFVIKRDPNAQFSFGTLQSSEAQRLLASIDLEPADLKTVIYLKDGKEMTRSTAALTILKDLGRLWSLCYAFIIIPPFIRDAVYGFIAKNRYKWFGEKEVCMIPSPELKARFLEA
ncbi:MAG: thiol-disulfide oxidoreductase DCC family protein [Flavobacteriales bacterium]|nr:thiol-disulfide oxidoreductase DCC family protein [Flavobacteriales bacterium]MBK6945765.1 thiol-disulfide oxidoreductase DCC family protein [Flavobacteriales bacterium]MBK7241864.1 thiol-disulfide oxidoreductase DCC family protein [Flavobacteriales bacterium]MBK9534685.1 thiol-disulfide oxidoreductase DCC family protein [Flavobacteriales bacterium]MBP9138280.1 thiol-disulfide oxidoreductase DCC family protein [Flavobacteriales bacterium]